MADLVMASINGTLSPPPHLDGTNSTLSAKRKRDDGIDAQDHANGISNSKIAKESASSEESQAVIRDLIDVLKMQVISTSTPHILLFTTCPQSHSHYG